MKQITVEISEVEEMRRKIEDLQKKIELRKKIEEKKPEEK
jgi:hypothetical protein